jgi:hypothetical protein
MTRAWRRPFGRSAVSRMGPHHRHMRAILWLMNGGQRAKQPMGFILHAGCEEDGVGVAVGAAITRDQRPEIADDDRSPVWPK